MFTDLQCRLLSRLFPAIPDAAEHERSYSGGAKIQQLLGDQLLNLMPGKTVIDFGCGGGAEAIEYARRGARQVIGLDIREDVLAIARERAEAAGLSDVCTFATQTSVPADIVVSIDSFEHFSDPAEILRIMDSLLRPEGQVIFSFGPPWLHPLGGHLFSVFPWAHLTFSEQALCRWRSAFKTDGAMRFQEVAGGLNQMTIGRFEELVKESPFRLSSLEVVPIRRLGAFHNRLTREYTTSVVRGSLRKAGSPSSNGHSNGRRGRR